MEPLSGAPALGVSLQDAPVAAITAVLGLSPGVALAVLVGVGLAAGIGLAAWYSWVVGSRGEASPGQPASRPRPESTAVKDGASTEPASDEDRIVRLLRDHGGRMKQTRIVEQTDWSKSKVSMLLSDMEEQGLISKLPVGRENLITLPGEEPDAVGTAYDDE